MTGIGSEKESFRETDNECLTIDHIETKTDLRHCLKTILVISQSGSA